MYVYRREGDTYVPYDLYLLPINELEGREHRRTSFELSK